MMKNHDEKFCENMIATTMNAKGYSILEFIITLVIIGILLFAGLSNLNTFLMRQERELCLDRLKNAITFARNEAFRLGKTVTLCGSHNQKTCHLDEEWTSGYMMYENEDNAKQPDTVGRIIKIFPKIRYGKIKFASSGPSLHIHANGMTMNMGSFTYSPLNVADIIDNQAKLVINRACRSYRE